MIKARGKDIYPPTGTMEIYPKNRDPKKTNRGSSIGLFLRKVLI
jgi:hypothetical protein